MNFAEKTTYNVDPLIPKLILDEMLNQCKKLHYTRSETTGNQWTATRSSSQHWMCWDTWIAGIMHNIFLSANNDYFQYDLNHFDSGIQVTRYAAGQQYGWHVDQPPILDNNNMTRKLSMSLLLNDGFSGGELQIYNPNRHQEQTIEMDAGKVCIFPSWVVHRVKPVTSGTRYSLVAWMNGPQFK